MILLTQQLFFSPADNSEERDPDVSRDVPPRHVAVAVRPGRRRKGRRRPGRPQPHRPDQRHRRRTPPIQSA